MPQFDLAVFPAQIFWLVIFFTTLMVYTVAVSVPRMKELLEERWQKTEGYRLEANRYSEQRTIMLQQVDQDLLKSRKKAHDVITQTQGDVNSVFTERKNAMIALMKTQMAAAESNIEAEKMKAVSEIKEHTQIITQEIVSKLLPMGGNNNDIKTMLDDKMDLKVSHGA